ncbi:DNA adenine methylase [Tolumonas auensis DSM 9187]|jgi:DNA adenine methylase|uniref:Site-specific DNA-methyltransferase (adenine-specific) n=1 Tax=Tolumonas auensis (strain DSM 9187 / NBRC 110442 / TA 4) TaxID=595494 RepID=C4LB05_TOLAT|nr:Dam family site-specific DNA-(adenine-N6)-methyltransferase [Tolumonas auensis]ACQ94208.1 DNA adenine methylase [Tolumonas auensis DSM 9187]NCB55965.1 Dam family site-specific DNA-(adenine-N6)-methyltransferase [Gammaproteobacteria bacterium]
MKKQRAFLKWAGGKYSLIESITQYLPTGKVLVEPFVGAGSVFLNTDYDAYLLADINPDLIALYNLLKSEPDTFIRIANSLFCEQNNQRERYFQLRDEFNQTTDTEWRSALFLYLNRHGYNGLCRYNRKGGFNVPFGRYKKPYFPEKELWFFAEKAQKATFVCQSFMETFAMLEQDHVVYCDPPYVPLSASASFTSYAAKGFSENEQRHLAELAWQAASEKRIPVLISNHATDLTYDLYKHASLHELQVKRTISRAGHSRQRVAELIARYEPHRLARKAG